MAAQRISTTRLQVRHNKAGWPALDAAAAGRAAYRDARLVASAAEAGCTAVLTEDLADGETLFGVRIVSPFGAGCLAAAALEVLEGG